MKTVPIETSASLPLVATEVLEAALNETAPIDACVLALTGELGAGKTAFTQALAANLGVREHVTSPTFVIMKSYPLTGHSRFTKLIHIDAYRIDDEAELVVLGIPALFADPNALIVIEWPERAPTIVPKSAYPVSITITEGTTRTFTHGY